MPEPWLPVVKVTLENPSRPELKARLDALIDTGSDISAIPHRVVRQLRLKSRRSVRVTGIDGLGISMKRYLVSVEMADTRLEWRRTIVWSGDLVVIARDILSEFAFTYDGKNRKFEIHDP